MDAPMLDQICRRSLNGESVKQIAEATGYTENSVRRIKKTPIAKQTMDKILDDLNLDKRAIGRKAKQLLDAKKTLIATYKGKITDTLEVPDNTTQREVLAQLADWQGISPFRKIQQDGGGGPKMVINVNPIFAQAFFGEGTHHGDADRYPDQFPVGPLQSRSDGAEDLAVSKAHDSD
jgi:hypothetical protein